MVPSRALWQRRLALVATYQGPVLIALGLALLAPAALAIWEADGRPVWNDLRGFVLPAIGALAAGWWLRAGRGLLLALTTAEAFLVTTTAWLVVSVWGAWPYLLVVGLSPIDALVEGFSGFTTVGATVISGLDNLPRSILLWRALTQWLGGIGILLLVLLVGRSQGLEALPLVSAEGVKVDSGRLSLNFRQAAYRFLAIYLILTLAQTLATTLLGMSLFDSLAHAMTTVATGGFSTHDESLAYYRARPAQFPHYMWLELVVAFFMLVGGINFYVLYRLGRRGEWNALWDGLEMRLLWDLLIGSVGAVTLVSWRMQGGTMGEWLGSSFFTVAALISTTGYEITPIMAFPQIAREIFLLLMLVGGCAGSTAGGFKIIRVGLLVKLVTHEIRQLWTPPHALHIPILDGRPISQNLLRQVVFLLLLWLVYLGGAGLMLTVLVPRLTLLEAYSAAFSALGGFGPSFLPLAEAIALPPPAKLVLILGMLAGRLEILPLLVFFNPSAWRR